MKRKADACDPRDIDKFVEYHTARGENLTGILSKVTLRVFLLVPSESLLFLKDLRWWNLLLQDRQILSHQTGELSVGDKLWKQMDFKR